MSTTASHGATRFSAVWDRCMERSASPAGDEVYAGLAHRLGAPDRRFHNLDHIHECLHHLDRVATLVRDRDAMELALWFHDAEYTPGDASNERRNA